LPVPIPLKLAPSLARRGTPFIDSAGQTGLVLAVLEDSLVLVFDTGEILEGVPLDEETVYLDLEDDACADRAARWLIEQVGAGRKDPDYGITAPNWGYGGFGGSPGTWWLEDHCFGPLESEFIRECVEEREEGEDDTGLTVVPGLAAHPACKTHDGLRRALAICVEHVARQKLAPIGEEKKVANAEIDDVVRGWKENL